MLTHPTIDQLAQLQLRGMADALAEQQAMDLADMTFEERLGLLVDREVTERASRRLKTRLTQAKLRQSACIEDIDFRARRGLDKKLVLKLADCDWIRQARNVLICGPCGVGKSYLACALAHKACQHGYRARYIRVSRLLDDITLARADGSLPRLMSALARMHVLILDDFALTPPTEQGRRDLLEVIEDRHGTRSTIITSQLPVESWHATLGEPTIADAILDRLVHNAHHINLDGDSMRKTSHAATPNP
ncbi:MAG: IstB domain protein ATP-binding protein [Thermoleophilia bacterium]|nr:IstB domain protein ATP-binding protein [Thermoleophilia bacterium]